MNNPMITPSVKVNIENLWDAIKALKARVTELEQLEGEPLAAPELSSLEARITTCEQVLWGDGK